MDGRLLNTAAGLTVGFPYDQATVRADGEQNIDKKKKRTEAF